ncbi:MAG: YARHG domain-containing protein [Lachnospiraceae bacterium]|nr:YARHG domain-containing protein [Lachnospiraceae bacterium]
MNEDSLFCNKCGAKIAISEDTAEIPMGGISTIEIDEDAIIAVTESLMEMEEGVFHKPYERGRTKRDKVKQMHNSGDSLIWKDRKEDAESYVSASKLGWIVPICVVVFALIAVIFFLLTNAFGNPVGEEASVGIELEIEEDVALPEEKVEPEEEIEPVDMIDASEFVFPDSDTVLLTLEDVHAVPQELRSIGRNEIFARHGRIFATERYRNHFENTSWYEGRIEPSEFDGNYSHLLSEIEVANIELILRYE